jgi:hypothetical protein
MTFTTLADAMPAQELDPATTALVEDVLETARAWEAGELTTPQALTIVLDTPRAIGTAFRYAWADPRRPALERLHAIEYSQREDEFGNTRVYTTFGWLPSHRWDQVVRHMSGPDIETLRYRGKEG